VVGAGVGHKSHQYYPEDEETRKERRRLEKMDVRE
jgi:hypothetical protein